MSSKAKIYLTKGINNGEAVWHYVKVDALKMPLFKRALSSGTLDVVDFGQILYSGWGKEPPEHISARIKATYR